MQKLQKNEKYKTGVTEGKKLKERKKKKEWKESEGIQERRRG